MAVSDQELVLRLKVVNIALGILQNGAHYIWAAPDSGVVPMAPDDLSADPTKRHVLAAALDNTHFCAGRSGNPAVTGLTAWTGSTVPTGSVAGLRFPRYWVDGADSNATTGEVVSGEACTGKMHFDCGSFVRYCFRTVLGSAILPLNVRMADIANPPIWTKSSGSASIDKVDLLPADIVYTADGHHVGLATGSAAYTKASLVPADQSVHAYYAKWGMKQTAIGDNPSWGVVRRWTKWG
jgi:hypothetical protein